MPSDGKRYELLDGELYMIPTPTTQHQRIVARIFVLVHEFLSSRQAGEVLFAPLDVVFDDRNVVQPDLLVVRSERCAAITPAYVAGPPDLVVEVLSLGTASYDREKKLHVYARAEVPEIWYVDGATETVEVLNLSKNRQYTLTAQAQAKGTIASTVLPGLSVDLRKIFSET